MGVLSADNHVYEYSFVAGGDSPSSHQRQGLSYKKGRDGTATGGRFPHTGSSRVKTCPPPKSQTSIGWTRDTYQALHKPSALEAALDVDKQAEINHALEFDDANPVNSLGCRVFRESTPPESFQKPVKRVSGVNKLGNAYRGVHYPDRTNSYEYENINGTHYEKHRDGSADLYLHQKLVRHYPPPNPGQTVRDEQYNTRFPVASRKAPAVKEQDIQGLESATSTRNRIGEGHKSYARSN